MKGFLSSGVPFRPRPAGPGGGAGRAISGWSPGGFWGGHLGCFKSLFLNCHLLLCCYFDLLFVTIDHSFNVDSLTLIVHAFSFLFDSVIL